MNAQLKTYTPGPWVVAEMHRGKYAGSVGIYPNHAQSPAFAILPAGRPDIQEANASLIAAAPDLAEALKALHQRYNDRKGIPYALDQQVRAALAKAGV